MRPRRNRVTPLGELVADPGRGLVYGNRGCLHDASGEIRRAWQGRRWIACLLDYKGRRRPLLQPGRYTELFFLDEATAFAAGHRPCAECRRPDYARLLELVGAGGADELDARLHAERLDGHERRLHQLAAAEVPDGSVVLAEGRPWLVHGDVLRGWTPAGYVGLRARPRGVASVLTPPTLLAALRSGWAGLVPLVHPSAATEQST